MIQHPARIQTGSSILYINTPVDNFSSVTKH
jgi:hypothetical protein